MASFPVDPACLTLSFRMDEGHTVHLVYLNFAKAFDSVNHRFLLAKLKSYGIDGAMLNWIKSYLSESLAFFLRGLLVLVGPQRLLSRYFFCYI